MSRRARAIGREAAEQERNNAAKDAGFELQCRRELGTILAALRFWQATSANGDEDRFGDILDIATDDGTLERLSDDEIDDLCERLNCGGYTGSDDELVAALESFLRAPAIGSKGPGSVTIEVQTYNLDAARAAIARAKGE